MSRRRKPTFSLIRCSHEPHPCAFGCGNSMRTKDDRHLCETWQWFCGYGDEVLHFCPVCIPKHWQTIAALRKALDVKPEGYPHVKLASSDMLSKMQQEPSK